MSKQALVPHTPEAHDMMLRDQVRINTIKHAHEQYTNARNNMVVMAFVIGFELTAQKDVLAHGRFEQWCEINLPEIKQQQRSRYMKFSVELQRRHRELGPEARALLLTNTDGGEVVRQENQTRLGEQIYELTDGASLTQLYKDTGVIPQPKKRAASARKVRVLNPAEKGQAERKRVLGVFGSLCESLHVLNLAQSQKALAALPPRDLKQLKTQWAEFSAAFSRQLKAIRD